MRKIIAFVLNMMTMSAMAPELDTLFSLLNERKAVAILHPYR